METEPGILTVVVTASFGEEFTCLRAGSVHDSGILADEALELVSKLPEFMGMRLNSVNWRPIDERHEVQVVIGLDWSKGTIPSGWIPHYTYFDGFSQKGEIIPRLRDVKLSPDELKTRPGWWQCEGHRFEEEVEQGNQYFVKRNDPDFVWQEAAEVVVYQGTEARPGSDVFKAFTLEDLKQGWHILYFYAD